MCGILGVIGQNTKPYDSKIESMLFCLTKRGPDEKGITPLSRGFFGQTRLSIIDISGGHQPMKDNKEDIVITFNGEIYNYKELKKELGKKGHIFSTKSDTEVIIKTYIEYGENCVNHFEGMFAFAIWDENKKQLFCARDRFGEKPFYYALESNNFIFASEIKAIYAATQKRFKIDKKSLDTYLTFMYVSPFRTIFEDVKVLPPASYLIYKDNKISINKYWSLKKTDRIIPYNEAKEEIKRLLGQSVKKMMVADIEVGAFLSGGVDSTLITYFAQKESDHKLKTFSVGYEDYINELPYALEASKKFNTDHYTLQVTGDSLDYIQMINEYFDEPHADSSNFPQYLVSNLASTKVKVALTGDGADELFYGYGWYWKHANLSWRHDFLEKLISSPFDSYIKRLQIFNSSDKNSLWLNQAPKFDYVPVEIKNSNIDQLEKINLFDLTYYLPGQLLTKIDRMAMMNSLEIRCPFLDRELVEFIFSLPNDYKTDLKNGKIILKEILAEIMPKKFVYRRKQGFGAPINKWLENEQLKKFIYSTLFEKQSNIDYILNKKMIKSIISEFYSGKTSNCYKVWSLLILELWLKKHYNYL